MSDRATPSRPGSLLGPGGAWIRAHSLEVALALPLVGYLLLLTAAQGTSVTISADGVDEIDAIATLRALVERGFDEATCA